jgi:hypothetical protein
MNSLERFNRILDHKKPDRMPLYIPTVACSVASQILGYEVHTGGDSLHFKEEFSWTLGSDAHDEFVHKYRQDTMALARALGVDVVREAWRCRRRPAKRIDEYTLLFGDEDGRYTVKRYFPETQSYGTVQSTGGCRDVDELKRDILASMEQSVTFSDEQLAGVYNDQIAIKKLADADYAVLAGALSISLPMENAVWLEATALEPELLKDYYLYLAEGMAKEVRWFRQQGFRFLNAGADIAAQNGPVISPKAFSFIVEPALKVLANECTNQGLTYCYRSDGNMWGLCDSIFKRAGVHAYGEVDRSATMTVSSLRERYPGVIILGNVSSITLCNGSEREVREETRATLQESFGNDYVAGPSNAIVHGTPVENVYAMVEEIRNYRP